MSSDITHTEPASQPAPKPAPEPASQPAPEPAPEPASQPASQPAPEPASQPAPDDAKRAEAIKQGRFRLVCLCMQTILNFLEEYAKATGAQAAIKKLTEVREKTPPQECVLAGAEKHAYELSLVIVQDVTNYNFATHTKKIREEAKYKDSILDCCHRLLNGCQEMHMVFLNSAVGQEICTSFAKGWDKIAFLNFDRVSHTIGIEGFPVRIGINIIRKHKDMPAAVAAAGTAAVPAAAV